MGKQILSPGIFIFGSVVISLALANSPLSAPFSTLLQTEAGPYSIQAWINDGLMAIFFLLVGLEIKRELVEGELSTPKKALLPVICAFGGALTPALIYIVFNAGKPTAAGWGIPMATDIAFALAILSTLSKKLPPSLKVFLAALAIVDDLMAILVIAIFYSGDLHLIYLLYAAAVMLLLFLLNRLNIANPILYLIPGVALWYFIHHSGIHATLAGVITALFIPARTRSSISPLVKLEHSLDFPVNYIIVPLFALANTNIPLEHGMIGSLFSSLGLGILGGLMIGKPLGVFLMALLGHKTGICHLPEGAGWRHITGLGVLAGIGFTMSIFMSILSFTDTALIAQAKFSILCGSAISAICGYLILRKNAVRG